MKKVGRALLSVYEKAGVVELAAALVRHRIEMLSTGGTAALLKAHGMPVRPVDEVTQFPEMLDGRVKTLHPRIHGGILAQRGKAEHRAQLAAHGIDPIDLVVVNLYPFEATIAKAGVSFEEVIENIDIGGPAMVRAAAKNFEDVAVLTDPADYEGVIAELAANDGALGRPTRYRLACKAFALTAAYDSLIAGYLGERQPGAREAKRAARLVSAAQLPTVMAPLFIKQQALRYGENPHQQAALYRTAVPAPDSVVGARQVHGKELSFNNYMDLHAAVELVREFETTAVVFIKHMNPCGVAQLCAGTEKLVEVYRKAREVDAVSAFGGVVSLNAVVDEATAREISGAFIEAVIAPGFSAAALEVLTQKKNVRLMELPALLPGHAFEEDYLDIKRISGGALVQTRDTALFAASQDGELRTVSRREPTASERRALLFAWKIAKHVKSNAIVYALEDRAVGIGAGQMSRVDSAKIAVMKAASPTKGAVMASDAFFPFRDGIDAAAEAGITAVIQPGGSVRDEEVIAAANEHGMAMLFTGMRHFRH
ncbi:MAG: bifunctional phosphoribosylaminoimidazolecarboxamide formyltransferase/IMP cyclohydrolase [Candidatus Tectomicrobia bacterium]|nr:bifunctional phosphoribosylaminoimidazolecarboxamide formyltransferase/IMP cyclohydrolase [Candidatus Tectomicrobia bacterium]